MTDELELLKRDWQKKGTDLPKLSYTEIQNMLWKKSSSIVKWILIISILEITLPNLIFLLPSVSLGKSQHIYSALGLETPLMLVSVCYYLVVAYFIFQFYKRYKEISVLENAKALMQKIIRTRRTVKHYIIFCLSFIMVFVLITMIGIYLAEDLSTVFPDMAQSIKKMDPQKMKLTIIGVLAVFGIVLTLLAGGIYFLLYGLLLRKLKHNYAELKKMEI